MRKLMYEIYKDNMKVAETASYRKMQIAKTEGYTVKEKLVEMKERVIYKRIRNEKEIESSILKSESRKWKNTGDTVKLEMGWVKT